MKKQTIRAIAEILRKIDLKGNFLDDEERKWIKDMIDFMPADEPEKEGETISLC